MTRRAVLKTRYEYGYTLFELTLPAQFLPDGTLEIPEIVTLPSQTHVTLMLAFDGRLRTKPLFTDKGRTLGEEGTWDNFYDIMDFFENFMKGRMELASILQSYEWRKALREMEDG